MFKPLGVFALQVVSWLFLCAVATASGCALFGLCGCSSPDASVSVPSLDKTLAALNFSQRGDAADSATVEVTETRVDSVTCTVSGEGEVSGKGEVSKASASPLASPSPSVNLKPGTFTRTVKITGPKAFTPPTPPAPPTPAEKAVGWFVVGAGGVGVLLALFAAFLTYGQHYKAAGITAITALAVPGCAVLLSKEWVYVVGAVGALIALTLWASWHFVKGKVPTEYGGKLKLSTGGNP
jgi:hypothetical protein